MMETHSLEVAYNLRKLFTYDSSYFPKEVKVQTENKPRKAYGEYAVIYLKTNSLILMKTYFGDTEPYANDLHVLNFT